jgi:hypothetical protein
LAGFYQGKAGGAKDFSQDTRWRTQDIVPSRESILDLCKALLSDFNCRSVGKDDIDQFIEGIVKIAVCRPPVPVLERFADLPDDPYAVLSWPLPNAASKGYSTGCRGPLVHAVIILKQDMKRSIWANPTSFCCRFRTCP